jgi:hypothetical protein
MLLCNNNRFGGSPLTLYGGVTSIAGAGLSNNRANFNQPGQNRGSIYGEGSAANFAFAARPWGYRNGGAWMLAQKTGALTSKIRHAVEFTTAATITEGRPIVGSASLAFTTTATGGLAVAGSSTISINFSTAANPTGKLAASSSVSFGFTVNTPRLDGRATLSAVTTVDLTTSAAIAARGFMVGTSTSESALSPESLAAAVLNATAANYNEPGSIGEKINDAGSAANPWTEDMLGGTYADGTAGDVVRKTFRAVWNAQRTNRSTGKMEIAQDAGFNAGVLYSANIYNDAAGTAAYDGSAGVERREKFEATP